jgi:hypothetical protein
VDYPNILLKRAIYDFEKEALVISTAKGNGSGNTTMTVRTSGSEHATIYGFKLNYTKNCL